MLLTENPATRYLTELVEAIDVRHCFPIFWVYRTFLNESAAVRVVKNRLWVVRPHL